MQQQGRTTCIDIISQQDAFCFFTVLLESAIEVWSVRYDSSEQWHEGNSDYILHSFYVAPARVFKCARQMCKWCQALLVPAVNVPSSRVTHSWSSSAGRSVLKGTYCDQITLRFTFLPCDAFRVALHDSQFLKVLSETSSCLFKVPLP